MTIQRDAHITFHEEGTLRAVTAWLHHHDAGLAELFKNTRRAYAADRAGLMPEEKVAVLLVRNADVLSTTGEAKPRIGVLDVGGASLNDILAWGEWQNPNASKRNGKDADEETQGNGGKTYLYKMFRGQASIMGVRDGRRNWRGFEGDLGSLDRGRPGWIPNAVEGQNTPLGSWKDELNRVLKPFGASFDDLPERVKRVLNARASFTFVQGEDPIDVPFTINAEDLAHKVARHGQATRAIAEVDYFVMQNGEVVNNGRPLKLDAIPAYPEFEDVPAIAIPETLTTEEGQTVSTTVGGKKKPGRLVLHTSAANMNAPSAKYLKARWKVTYWTEKKTVAGEKDIGALAPATPGSVFIYGEVELDALADGYVNLGRGEPVRGPLTEALNAFIGEEIRKLAHAINEKRRHEFKEEALDEVQKENDALNRWKNRFMPSDMVADGPTGTTTGTGSGSQTSSDDPPATVVLAETGTIVVGRGVGFHLKHILQPVVKDAAGKTIRGSEIEWDIERPKILEQQGESDRVVAMGKGTTTVRAKVKGTDVASEPVVFDVWIADHVLLTPRTMVVKVGKRQRVIAEVTNDEGKRSTDVLLNWKHMADDQLIVRVNQTGWVSGNRIGRTTVTAGAGDVDAGGCWASIPVDVEVVPNLDDDGNGDGFPQLLLTDRDVDPATGEVRPGDTEQPALWQDPMDEKTNVWWLNLQSAEAAFAFNQREVAPIVWRTFHALKTVEMVGQVHMNAEYSAKGEQENKEYWGNHKQHMDSIMVRLTPQMWETLQEYVLSGKGLP